MSIYIETWLNRLRLLVLGTPILRKVNATEDPMRPMITRVIKSWVDCSTNKWQAMQWLQRRMLDPLRPSDQTERSKWLCLCKCGIFSRRIWLHCFGGLRNGSRWRCQMSRLWCHCPTAPASASLGASAGGSDGITCSSSGFEGKQKNHILKWTFVAKFMKSWRNLTSCLHILQLQELWTPDLPEKHTTNEASSSRGLRLVPTGLAWAALAFPRGGPAAFIWRWICLVKQDFINRFLKHFWTLRAQQVLPCLFVSGIFRRRIWLRCFGILRTWMGAWVHVNIIPNMCFWFPRGGWVSGMLVATSSKMIWDTCHTIFIKSCLEKHNEYQRSQSLLDWCLPQPVLPLQGCQLVQKDLVRSLFEPPDLKSTKDSVFPATKPAFIKS